MFYGEYRHQLDEKNRLRIPAKLKELLGERAFITKGPNNCLIVLPESEANILLANKFKNVDIVDPYRNISLRMLTSSAFVADEDKQGRIIIPNKLLEHIKVKTKDSDEVNRNIVTIGAFNRIEIWCESVWDKYSDLTSEEFDARLAETLSTSSEVNIINKTETKTETKTDEDERK